MQRQKLKKKSVPFAPVRGVLPTRLDSPEFRSEMRFNKQRAEEQVQNWKKTLMRRGASEADAEKEVRRLLRQEKEQREKWADETFGRFTKDLKAQKAIEDKELWGHVHTLKEREQMKEMLKKKFGYTEEQAEKKVNNLLKEFKKQIEKD